MIPKILEVKYEPIDDVLNIYFSKNQIDDSYDVEDLDYMAIMHLDKAEKPVYLEIFDASKHFNVPLSKVSEKVKQEFFAPA